MNGDNPLVLGIETSCDETGVGIVRGSELLANVIASSMEEHARYGGVVPEIAARAHLEALTPAITAALAEAGVTLQELDAIAVTSGPGLAGALMVGVGAAKALAVALDKPLYAVNHLVGHVGADILTTAAPVTELPGAEEAPVAEALEASDAEVTAVPEALEGPASASETDLLGGTSIALPTGPPADSDESSGLRGEGPATSVVSAAAARASATFSVNTTPTGPLEYPTIALLVSGGHTSLLLVRDLVSDVELLGETIDDAAGEAFDKVARLLGLPYPGGPEIDRAALGGDPAAIRFPRGLSQTKDLERHRYDFSFSGLKTAVARHVERLEDAGEPVPIADVAASFREAVVDVLITKALAACADHGVPRLLLGGGVVANARVREVAARRCADAGVALRIPPLSLCTDNGAMIASVGAQLIMAGHEPSSLAFGADSTLPVTVVQPR